MDLETCFKVYNFVVIQLNSTILVSNTRKSVAEVA